MKQVILILCIFFSALISAEDNIEKEKSEFPNSAKALVVTLNLVTSTFLRNGSSQLAYDVAKNIEIAKNYIKKDPKLVKEFVNAQGKRMKMFRFTTKLGTFGIILSSAALGYIIGDEIVEYDKKHNLGIVETTGESFGSVFIAIHNLLNEDELHMSEEMKEKTIQARLANLIENTKDQIVDGWNGKRERKPLISRITNASNERSRARTSSK